MIAKPFYTKKDIFKCMWKCGKNCKSENYRLNSNNAIKGLNSNQINEDIIVSQRPCTQLIHNYNLNYELKKYNIGLIVNLQIEGEHPYCSPDGELEDTGFSYIPEYFEAEGIPVLLAGWKSLDTPETVLWFIKILKTISEIIIKGKKRVLIHCHCGVERSPVLAACYLIATTNIPLNDAISLIKERRKGSLEGEEDVKFIRFIQECKLNNNIYPNTMQ